MDQRLTDSATPSHDESKSLDPGLRGLWERTKLAGDLIVQLRQEKGILQSRAEDLEKQVTVLRQELTRKEELMRKMESERIARESQQTGIFSNGEREMLTMKLKDLLAKIDAYL